MSFLSLPTEIRALIIKHALFARHEPPARPSTQNRSVFHDIPYKAWKQIVYSAQFSTHSPSNCLSLLVTCRQLFEETRTILDLPSDPRVREYHLDISLLDEVFLLPMWTSVPQLTNHISTLHAEIRLFGPIISFARARNQCGDGGHGGFQWSFYALLERFLAYGPVGNKETERVVKYLPDGRERPRWTNENPSFTDRNITIDTLVLDVTSAEPGLEFPPEDVDFRRWWMRHHGWHSGKDMFQDQRARPEWVAQYLYNEISGLLGLNYHTEAYGKILHERIGTIRILVEGEPFREYRLPEVLASLKRPEKSCLPGEMLEKMRG